MDMNDLLTLIEPRWHQEFLRFVDTGEAEEGFLSYLDKDKKCQQAVEKAFTTQAAAFEDFARALSTPKSAHPEQIEKDLRAATVSANMATAFEGALDLPVEVRKDVLQRAVSALIVSVKPEKQKELRSMVEDLEKKVEAVQYAR